MTITLAEWCNDPETVSKWVRTWQEPHMQMGLALLREVNLPIQLTSPEGIPFKDWMASEESRREGYYEFYRLIQSLGKVKELPKGTEPEAWSIPTRPPPPKIE